MTDPALDCRQVIDFLAAYLDGELSQGERSDFEAHLTVCPDCVSYLESYRETARLGAAAWDAAEAAAAVPESLVQAVLASRRR